jgi:hypothetical protein
MKGAGALELLGIYDLYMKCLQVRHRDEMKEHTPSWTDEVGMRASDITDSPEWKYTAILVTFKVGNKA